MTDRPRVLVVDDEPNIRDLLATVLRFHGFDVTTADRGATALDRARRDPPDVVVLDVGLPDLDGFEVCRLLRADGDAPGVVFLTARDDPRDTVTGLALGGDDYVTKPFVVDVLVARVRAVLRRLPAPPDGEPARAAGAAVLRCDDLELDDDACLVRRGGTPVELSPTEYRLLRHLLQNQGRVLSRAQILDAVWSYDFGGASTVVDTYVGYLRRKLDPLGPPLIHTQRGFGYVLRASRPGA
jgi:two-component system OmpR family response regulator